MKLSKMVFLLLLAVTAYGKMFEGGWIDPDTPPSKLERIINVLN